ncbi:helix-turn-helix domain-containing protein [Micromonospora sp. CPCC 205371]|nr:helix-turn-helix domain-containing protein [Micromonospora sp. CPCC 205371]
MTINAEPVRPGPGIVETVLHPVRLRIVHALVDRELTARQLGAVLSDVPQASLYRHVGRLVDAGVLRVTREERVRGGTQRTYTVVESAVTLAPQDFAAASLADHQRYFAAFVGALIAGFEQYLRTTGAAPIRDGVVYQQIPVWVTPTESRQLTATITDLLRPLRARTGGRRRRRTTFAMVLHPDSAT